MRTVKLPNLTKNDILSNFYLHGLSPIYSELWRLEIPEFATVITQNISDLDSQP